MLAEIGKEIIQGPGYNLTVAPDSSQAFELFMNTPESYDLVITDQTIPDMIGTEIDHLSGKFYGFSGRYSDAWITLLTAPSHTMRRPGTYCAVALCGVRPLSQQWAFPGMSLKHQIRPISQPFMKHQAAQL